MTTPLDSRAFPARLQHLEALLREAERFTDPTMKIHAREIARAILDLHGAGLKRALELITAGGEAGRTVLDACAEDDLVSGLLLLHGLHPLDLEARVRQALDHVRPSLHAHGGSVELLGVSEGVVRLRLEGNGNGCPSSGETMRQIIEEAILARAPDVVTLEVEGIEGAPPANARVALPVLGGLNPDGVAFLPARSAGKRG